jgi:hypothetical protein
MTDGALSPLRVKPTAFILCDVQDVTPALSGRIEKQGCAPSQLQNQNKHGARAYHVTKLPKMP